MGVRTLAGLAAVVLVLVLGLAPAARATGGTTLITQVHNQSLTGYDRDYVTLLNRGSQPASLGGFTLQFRPSGGGPWTVMATLPAVTLPAGRSYLVARSDAGGGSTSPLPAAADVLAPGLEVSSGGSVALVAPGPALTCTTSSECGGDQRLADLLGYGGAPIAEATATSVVALGDTAMPLRLLYGCKDTDDNAADIGSGPGGVPRTLASPAIDCAGLGPGTTTDAPTATCGEDLTAPAGQGAQRTVSATDPDDRVTDISATLGATMPLSVEGLQPSTTVGGTATARILVPPGLAAGSYTALVTAVSGPGGLQTATCQLLIRLSAAPVAPVGGPPTRAQGAAPKPAFSSLVALPGARTCVSRRRFNIRLRVPRDSTVISAEVKVNGKRVAVRKGSRLRSVVGLTKFPKGRFRVDITMKFADGQTVKGTRTYRACTVKPRAPAGSRF